MDRRERTNDRTEALRAMLDGFRATLWTALPFIVESYDAEKMIVSVQPSIQGKQLLQDGTLQDVTITILPDVPVFFPGGGGFTFTFPIAKGDEGLVVFSSRCIDAWWQSGGVQPQAELRMHDLSDGFAFIGFRSQARLLSDVSTDTAQLRNDAGDTYVEIADGQVVNVVAPGGINLNGVLIDSDGNISGVGTLDASGEGTFNSHTVGAHIHSDPQGGDTGPPTG